MQIVIKRDGSQQVFNLNKIIRAVEAAFNEVEKKVTLEAHTIASNILFPKLKPTYPLKKSKIRLKIFLWIPIERMLPDVTFVTGTNMKSSEEKILLIRH